LLTGEENERPFDFSYYNSGMAFPAGVAFAPAGGFHLNETCLSGRRQKEKENYVGF